jgi:hypothetical protein
MKATSNLPDRPTEASGLFTCYVSLISQFKINESKLMKHKERDHWDDQDVGESLRVARGWGSHIFRYSARLSALRAGRYLPPERFLVLISVRGWVDPRAIVRLEELGKLKKSTSSGTWASDLPTSSIVPQSTTLQRSPQDVDGWTILKWILER